MSGNVEVQDPATSVLDDEEAVEQSEGQRRDREEVEGTRSLAMILEKSNPVLIWIATTLNASRIPSHTSFGHCQAEF